MTNKQLKNLKDRLWQGADQLRANSGLKSTEYATPILGLICPDGSVSLPQRLDGSTKYKCLI